MTILTRSHAIVFYDSVLVDCIFKSGKHKRGPDFVPKDSHQDFAPEDSHARLHPTIVLHNAWKVQHDEEVQQLSGTEESCAEGDPFKIDLRVQGVPQNAVIEDQGRFKTWWIRSELSPEQYQ